MTTGHDQDPARQYLAAIGAALTVDGIPCRLTRDGGTPPGGRRRQIRGERGTAN